MNDNLVKLFELCGKYKVDFVYNTKEGGDNKIILEKTPKIKVIANINDPYDEKLKIYLNTRVSEIKNIFEQLFPD